MTGHNKSHTKLYGICALLSIWPVSVKCAINRTVIYHMCHLLYNFNWSGKFCSKCACHSALPFYSHNLGSDFIIVTILGPNKNDNPPQPRLACIEKQIDDDKLQVINLSSQALSETEKKVLGLGLTNKTDSFEVVKDLNLFACRLTYKYLYDEEREKKQNRKS